MKTAPAVTGKAASPNRNRLILLVECGDDDRRRLGAWLEGAGYSLMDCLPSSDKPVLILADKAESGLSFDNHRVALAKRSSSKAVLAVVSDLLDGDCLTD